MISVIMPTLWRGEYYKQMLPLLNAHPLIAEIVIIDNDPSSTDKTILNLNKVRHLPQEQNIYVNPAWNLGVEESRQDIICLYSDDVLFDIKCIEEVYATCKPENGIIGFSIEVISESGGDLESLNHQLASWETQCIVATPSMHYRFGICMFMHKNAYYRIPEEYKIYYGDTYLFDQNVISGKQNFKIDGVPVITKMKSTSKNFEEIINRDKESFNLNNPADRMMSEFMSDLEKQLKL